MSIINTFDQMPIKGIGDDLEKAIARLSQTLANFSSVYRVAW